MIRVMLPGHLRTLARVEGEVELEVEGPVTQRSVLDALEARYPALQGTVRDHVTQKRRPFVRFFACQEDWSHESPDAALPDAVARGDEPFLVVGAIAGGAESSKGDRGQHELAISCKNWRTEPLADARGSETQRGSGPLRREAATV